MYAERETLLAISLGQLSLKTFRLPSGVESVSQRFGQTSIPSVLVILLSGAIPVPSLQLRDEDDLNTVNLSGHWGNLKRFRQ